jgi:hypothetical protein
MGGVLQASIRKAVDEGRAGGAGNRAIVVGEDDDDDEEPAGRKAPRVKHEGVKVKTEDKPAKRARNDEGPHKDTLITFDQDLNSILKVSLPLRLIPPSEQLFGNREVMRAPPPPPAPIRPWFFFSTILCHWTYFKQLS